MIVLIDVKYSVQLVTFNDEIRLIFCKKNHFFLKNTHITEDIMATVELFRELIVWVVEIFETVFPQSHFFE